MSVMLAADKQSEELPGGLDSKESSCNAGDLGLIPGLGRSPGAGVATHSSILAWRIPMDRGAWRGYSPWGHKEPDTAERLSTEQHSQPELNDV